MAKESDLQKTENKEIAVADSGLDEQSDEKVASRRRVVVPLDLLIQATHQEVAEPEEISEENNVPESEKVKVPASLLGMDEEEEDEEAGPAAAKPTREQRRRELLRQLAALDAEEDDEEKMVEIDTDMIPRLRELRARRLASMGQKSEDYGDDAFLCAYERKVRSASEGPCDACQGGCRREGNLPGLLEIEGLAEESYGGKVLDSGYAANDDIFIVDIQRKSDNKVIEGYFSGEGESLGWLMLNQELIGEKSAIAGTKVISMEEAEEIALKNVPGEVYGIDAEIFEGFDAYAVEIEHEGKSYDAYVSLDGQFLGYDEYVLDGDDEDLKAEEAELELKRKFNTETRQQMAERGTAMPDGSFPIGNEADLRNAMQAIGRAKDPDAAKRHIRKRARALGLEHLLTDAFKSAEDDPETQDLLRQLEEFKALAEEAELE